MHLAPRTMAFSMPTHNRRESASIVEQSLIIQARSRSHRRNYATARSLSIRLLGASLATDLEEPPEEELDARDERSRIGGEAGALEGHPIARLRLGDRGRGADRAGAAAAAF